MAHDASLTQGIESQYRFEVLVASICSRLANAQPDNVDELVTQSLAQIGDAMGGNRVLLAQVEEATGELLARAQFRTTDPPFPERLSIGELNPSMWRTLTSGEVSNVPDVAALPGAATHRSHLLPAHRPAILRRGPGCHRELAEIHARRRKRRQKGGMAE